MPELSLAASLTRSAATDRPVAYWLLLCCAMVYATVVIGGITRLTLSGLSIVEWNPIMGVVPPLSESDWQAPFDLYKETPQYLALNRGMSLAEFKTIFWWEYAHRLWGRLIGVVFLLPFLYFLLRGRLARRLIPRLALIFALGAVQAAVGWFMVESGLVDRPSVSQYRLAGHLAIALVIYTALLWLALDLLFPRASQGGESAASDGFRRARWLAGWVFVVAVSGAFVAGLHAGLIYNSFPLMDGRLIPAGLFGRPPSLSSLFDDVTTVQFDHRLLALATFALVVLFWLSLRRSPLPPRARLAADLLLIMVLLQVGLGIATLVLAVPIPLAAAHQAGALMLFTLVLWAAHELRDIKR